MYESDELFLKVWLIYWQQIQLLIIKTFIHNSSP